MTSYKTIKTKPPLALSAGLAIALLSTAAPCQPVKPQEMKVGQALDGGHVVRALSGGDAPWAAIEKTDATSGEIVFIEADGGSPTRVKKVLGGVGPQSDPYPVAPYPKELQEKLHTSNNDFLAETYLAEKNAANEDPTFADIRKLFPPVLYPETNVGMNSYPHNVAIGANGSVEMNLGFMTGVELTYMNYCQHMQFLLNGRKPTPKECEANINRRLLGGWLPATDYRYRMADQPLGWEQAVVMGHYKGSPGLFIRFRITNLDDKPQVASFAIDLPQGGRFEPSPDGLKLFAPKLAGGYSTFDNDPERNKTFAEMQASMPWEVPFSVGTPCEIKDGRPSWQFSLPAKGSRDLYLAYAGFHDGKLTRVPDSETALAFYAALKEQTESWNSYLADAAEIPSPEPGLEDIFRATLCRILCTAHGDKFEGGMLHYRGFWQFTHLHAVRLMTDAGLFAKARAALVYFMDDRILPDGKFRFDFQQYMYQIFDIGEFLQAMAKYYQTTGDASLILEHQEEIARVFKLLQDNRAQSMEKFPKGDPRHGMLFGSFENDVPEQGYYYTNDFHVWFGLRDYSAALTAIAATPQGAALRDQAAKISHFTTDFHRNLRASFDKAGIIRDASGNIVAFNCAPDIKGEGIKSRFFTDEHWNMYRRFQQQPRMFAHSFASDDETNTFLDYQAANDQTILGVRRWRPDVLDDFVAFETDYQRLRLDRVREFQMKFFAYLQTVTAVGTWTGYEEAWLFPPNEELNARAPYGNKDGVLTTFEGLHATIVTPMLTKQMYCFDEPTADAIWLAAGVSTHWLKDGKPLAAKRLGSRFGLVDLTLTWREADQSLTTVIVPQPGRTMTEVRLRLRAPGGKPLKSAVLADGSACEIKGDLAILRGITQTTTVTATFEE